MRIIILITAIFLLSAAAFAQYETLAGIETESSEYNDYKLCIDSCSQCEANCKTNTYRRAAETENKEEFCNYLPEGEKRPCKERIYMAKAIAGKDPAECGKITDEFQKSGCLLNVQTEKAVAGENEAECGSLEAAFADSCRQAFNMRMASLKSDESYCGKLADAAAKSICMDSVKMQKLIAEPMAKETAKQETPVVKPEAGKSLIIYGIIILGVIIFAVLAVVIVKKRGRKKQGAPLMIQQKEMKQQGPPLVLQKEPVQQFPKAGEAR